jgi:linalool dehydratase/isomerase-like protein
MMKLSIFNRQTLVAFAAIVVAGCIWTPCLHLVFRRDLSEYRARDGVSPIARKLVAAHLATWSDPELRQHELDKMREKNPEWDFMSRTYLVLALVNVALEDEQFVDDACDIVDSIIQNTLEVEKGRGFEHFLMSYGHGGWWAVRPPRSVFVDGEIALMLAARRILKEEDAYKAPLTERVEAMISRMQESPVQCAESYPDECWLFCNTVALAAIRMADVLDGGDHSDFVDSWVDTAKAELLDSDTGLLISTYAVDGTPSPSGFGPEGSTIWMASHMLQIVDEGFAEDQYRRAHKQLARSLLGFGYSREWPLGQEGQMDVDSGPVIPVFGASASASGLAILAAAAFDDEEYLRSLLTSLQFMGFPAEREGRRHYEASNPVGDAVLLYAMTEGPLWDLVRERMVQ